MSNAVFRAEGFKPFGSPPAGCNNGAVGKNFRFVTTLAVLETDALAFASLKNKVAAFIAEHHFNAVFEKILFNGKVDSLRLFRTHVADRAVNKLQACLNGLDADFLFSEGILKSFNVLVGAELKIYFVRVINGFLRLLSTDERGQISADFIAKRKLSVGKSACAGKAGSNVAIRLAGNADLGLILGAVSVFNSLSFFNDHNALF